MNRVDHKRRSVWCDGQEFAVSPSMFRMCAFLAAKPDEVRETKEILRELGVPYASNSVVNDRVARLKKKGVTCIMKRPLFGYMWVSGRKIGGPE